MRRQSILGIAVLLLAIPATLVAPGPALADPAPDPTVTTGATPVTGQRVEMRRVGVDHAVAKANGFEVRVDSKGVEYAVPAGTPIGINNEVPGPCGWSWFWWVDIDFWGNRASIYSGFEILSGWPAAVSVPNWDVTVVDNYGVSTKHLAPPLAVIKPAHVWVSPRHRFGSSGDGDVFGEVTWGVAILANGTICFALEPWDSVEL